MDMSIWIAKFLGPVLLATAIPMIISPRSTQALADDFLKTRSLIFVTGVLVLVAGLSIVNTHNRWSLDWTLIVTLLGWAMVVGGALRIIMPQVVAKVGGTMIGHAVATRLAGVVWGLVGGLLTFKGYFDAA